MNPGLWSSDLGWALLLAVPIYAVRRSPKDNRRRAYIDTRGKIAIRGQFRQAYEFSEGLARVEL